MNEEMLRLKRERMGLRGSAGLISRARFDGVVAEGSDPRIRSAFAHILNGGMRERIRDFDSHELSVMPGPMTSSGLPAQTRKRAEDTPMSKKQRMYQQRMQQSNAPQQSPPQDLVGFSAPSLNQEDSSFLNQVNAMFGETPRGKALPDISGRLLPDRGHSTELDLGGYGSAPFDPMNQIMQKATRRGSRGVDYRELEEMAKEPELDDESRYLSQASYRQSAAPAYDDKTMQAMARSMAEAMVKTVMQEHIDKNRGRKYFKEVKTKRDIFKNSPTSKLVEIDGKYYKMDLKPVKIKSSTK